MHQRGAQIQVQAIPLAIAHSVAVAGAMVQPRAFARVEERDAARRPPPGQAHRQAREMVLDHPVPGMPGRMGTERGGVITLGLAGHGIPGQVVDAQDDAQGGLPVPLPFVSGKGEIPVGDPIHFAHQSGPTVLPGHRLGLFGRGQFQ